MRWPWEKVVAEEDRPREVVSITKASEFKDLYPKKPNKFDLWETRILGTTIFINERIRELRAGRARDEVRWIDHGYSSEEEARYVSDRFRSAGYKVNRVEGWRSLRISWETIK